MRNVYVVILAGGSGQRLWPISTPDHPKQILPFIGQKSLLQLTYERIQSLVDDKNNIILVTVYDQKDLILQDLEKHGSVVGKILCESVGKNTAPAIYLACDYLQKNDPEALVVILPADHFIPDSLAFSDVLHKALLYTNNHDELALIGIRPQFPATGYGYIQTGDVIQEPGVLVFRVLKFHEKPSRSIAQEYFAMQHMWWNSGMVVARITRIMRSLMHGSPVLFSQLVAFSNGQCDYKDLMSISFDYAVLEQSDHVVLFPAMFDWYDVGNVHTFLTLKQAHDCVSQVMNIHGSGNLTNIMNKKVVCIGLNDVCIMESEKFIVLVAKDDVELVKQAAQETDNLLPKLIE